MVLNRTYRLGLAFCLAMFIHFMVLAMEAAKKPSVIPDFHIPRSVNVFLGQPPQPQNISARQQTIEPLAEQIAAEPVLEETATEKTSQVQEQAATEKNQTPVLPINETPDPIVGEVETLNDQQPLSDKKTADVVPGSKTEVDAQLSNVSKNAVDTGQQHVGAVRMARPKYRENSPPIYPKRARKRGYEGTVVLRVLVNRQGRVDDLLIDVSSNHAMLDRAAVNSVRKWFFEPGRRGNEEMDMWVKVPVTFRLQE